MITQQHKRILGLINGRRTQSPGLPQGHMAKFARALRGRDDRRRCRLWCSPRSMAKWRHEVNESIGGRPLNVDALREELIRSAWLSTWRASRARRPCWSAGRPA